MSRTGVSPVLSGESGSERLQDEQWLIRFAVFLHQRLGRWSLRARNPSTPISNPVCSHIALGYQDPFPTCGRTVWLIPCLCVEGTGGDLGRHFAIAARGGVGVSVSPELVGSHIFAKGGGRQRYSQPPTIWSWSNGLAGGNLTPFICMRIFQARERAFEEHAWF